MQVMGVALDHSSESASSQAASEVQQEPPDDLHLNFCPCLSTCDPVFPTKHGNKQCSLAGLNASTAHAHAKAPAHAYARAHPGVSTCVLVRGSEHVHVLKCGPPCQYTALPGITAWSDLMQHA